MPTTCRSIIDELAACYAHSFMALVIVVGLPSIQTRASCTLTCMKAEVMTEYVFSERQAIPVAGGEEQS